MNETNNERIRVSTNPGTIKKELIFVSSESPNEGRKMEGWNVLKDTVAKTSQI